MIYNMILADISSLVLLNVSNVNNTASWLTFAKAVGQLFFLILLFVLLYWLMTKMRANFGTKSNRKSSIQIIERKYLNNLSSLTLVKVKDKVLLLGVTKEKMSLLAEFDEENFIDEEEEQTAKFKEIFDNKFFNTNNQKNRSKYENEEN